MKKITLTILFSLGLLVIFTPTVSAISRDTLDSRLESTKSRVSEASKYRYGDLGAHLLE